MKKINFILLYSLLNYFHLNFAYTMGSLSLNQRALSTNNNSTEINKIKLIHEFVLAAKNGKLDLVKKIFEKNKKNFQEEKFDINSVDYWDKTYNRDCIGTTALAIACQEGHGDIVRYLIGEDVNINFYENEVNINIPVYYAILNGYFSIVKYLHFRGSEIDKEIIFKHKKMPLVCFAALIGYKNILQYFLQNGVDVNSKGQGDITPLLIAVSDGCLEADQNKPNLEIIELLLEQKNIIINYNVLTLAKLRLLNEKIEENKPIRQRIVDLIQEKLEKPKSGQKVANK